MTIKLDVRIRVDARAKDSYSTETIVSRDINCIVPPGIDPMVHLSQLLRDERDAVTTAFGQFPQYLALTDEPTNQKGDTA